MSTCLLYDLDQGSIPGLSTSNESVGYSSPEAFASYESGPWFLDSNPGPFLLRSIALTGARSREPSLTRRVLDAYVFEGP
ncbi:hypothetical protein DPMN_093021 [Dreissena polymorpha]|uniref:Uncharacterized protein n=1 Tax=Dreissena polymorpha TaxID=45954 RepID=A0A9D4L3E5_DREPO|nr:hypothetical protein DPMN_093021 [Dreissena polymorpha]